MKKNKLTVGILFVWVYIFRRFEIFASQVGPWTWSHFILPSNNPCLTFKSGSSVTIIIIVVSVTDSWWQTISYVYFFYFLFFSKQACCFAFLPTMQSPMGGSCYLAMISIQSNATQVLFSFLSCYNCTSSAFVYSVVQKIKGCIHFVNAAFLGYGTPVWLRPAATEWACCSRN